MSIKKDRWEIAKDDFCLVKVAPVKASAARKRNSSGSPTRKDRSIGALK
jgi:hypothetical protein